MIARLTVLSAPLVLVACISPGTDPCAAANRDISFGNLLSSSVSGSYDSCLASLEGELAAIRLENSELRSKADRLRRESSSLSAEETRLLAEEAALQREINSLSRASSPDPAEVKRVRDRQRELNRQLGAILG